MEGQENGNKIVVGSDGYPELMSSPSPTYKQYRRQEYPPIEDYLDAIVKSDEQQLNEYISKCLEVKAKYPKP